MTHERYEGGCQCGAVRYAVSIDLDNTITCGVESFAYGTMPDGSPTVAINANCLDGVDPRALKSHHVDGRSF